MITSRVTLSEIARYSAKSAICDLHDVSSRGGLCSWFCPEPWTVVRRQLLAETSRDHCAEAAERLIARGGEDLSKLRVDSSEGGLTRLFRTVTGV